MEVSLTGTTTVPWRKSGPLPPVSGYSRPVRNGGGGDTKYRTTESRIPH